MVIPMKLVTMSLHIMQDWSMYTILDEIIDANGYFREFGNISDERRPLNFEFNELQKTLTDFVEIYSGGRLGANSSRLGKNK